MVLELINRERGEAGGVMRQCPCFLGSGIRKLSPTAPPTPASNYPASSLGSSGVLRNWSNFTSNANPYFGGSFGVASRSWSFSTHVIIP